MGSNRLFINKPESPNPFANLPVPNKEQLKEIWAELGKEIPKWVEEKMK